MSTNSITGAYLYEVVRSDRHNRNILFSSNFFCYKAHSEIWTRQPFAYKATALPLCYAGKFIRKLFVRPCSENASILVCIPQFFESCPEESNPVYLDISQTPNTVEDKQDIWPENTVIGNTLWNPYELGSFPRIFQCVCAVHAFLKEAVPFSSEILDLLFNLTRDVRSLIMPTFSTKSFRLASSTIPCCVSATDLMHFLPEPLPTFAFGDFNRVWTCDLLFKRQTLYHLSHKIGW